MVEQMREKMLKSRSHDLRDQLVIKLFAGTHVFFFCKIWYQGWGRHRAGDVDYERILFISRRSTFCEKQTLSLFFESFLKSWQACKNCKSISTHNRMGVTPIFIKVFFKIFFHFVFSTKSVVFPKVLVMYLQLSAFAIACKDGLFILFNVGLPLNLKNLLTKKSKRYQEVTLVTT